MLLERLRNGGSVLTSGRLALHMLLTGVMAAWAFTLMLPEPTFAVAPGFDWFAAHWPRTEIGWSYMFCVATACGLIGLVLDNRYGARFVSILFLSSAHSTVAFVTLTQSYSHDTAVPAPIVYFLLATAGWWLVATER